MMAGHPGNVLAVCWYLLDSTIAAITLPNSTYLPHNFDDSSIKSIVEGLRLSYMTYKVKTADGYILNLNRIVNPDKMHVADLGVPVLFVSGMGMQSDAWLVQPKPELNLPIAYLMEGYDVWLGDQRGTLRSRQHVSLDDRDWRFWDFSFHETGVFDLPAFVDFILEATGHPKLVYSGVSLGGAFYYVMCAERPEYQEKLYGGILWQPVGEMPAARALPWTVMMNVLAGQTLLELEWSMGIGEVPPFNHFWRPVFDKSCRLMQIGARHTATMILGQGCHFGEDICRQISLALGGTSAKTVLHTLQLFRNGGVFGQYDYGLFGNLLRYRRRKPPTYDMRKLKVSTALYTSDIDIYTPTRTVVKFSKQFSGPTYTCDMAGVCHGFAGLDARAGPHVMDSIEVLNSMTGRTSNAKMASRRCHVPTPIP